MVFAVAVLMGQVIIGLQGVMCLLCTLLRSCFRLVNSPLMIAIFVFLRVASWLLVPLLIKEFNMPKYSNKLIVERLERILQEMDSGKVCCRCINGAVWRTRFEIVLQMLRQSF